MYPTVGHLLSDLLGTRVVLPLPTFGLLVLTSLIVATLWVKRELKRAYLRGWFKDREQILKGPERFPFHEVLISAIVGFLIFWKLVYVMMHPDEFMMAPDKVIFSSVGAVDAGLLGAVIFGVWSAWRTWRFYDEWRGKERVIRVAPHEEVVDLLVWAIIPGLILAKVFHALEYPQEFIEDPAGMLFSTGGFTFYGGVLGGALGVIIFARRRGWNIWRLGDIIGQAILLGYAIGRVGCHLAGDGDWGIVNSGSKPGWLSWIPDWLWAFTYPHNVIMEGVPIPGCEGLYCYQLPEPVYPAPLYESIMSLIAFGAIQLVKPAVYRKFRSGILLALSMILMGVERFLIEFIRVNPRYELFGIEATQAQIISVLLVLGGLLIIYLRAGVKAGKDAGDENT